MNTAIPITRIFQSIALNPHFSVELDPVAFHHVVRVLRAKVGDLLILFNGEGGEYLASITQIDKKKCVVDVKDFIERDVESPLILSLAQGISRGEKMDFTIQKAVELGVNSIFPLFTERCNVKLENERREKRFQHWRSIMIGACEQSGRNRIPDLSMPMIFEKFLQEAEADWKFVLAPRATDKLSAHSILSGSSVLLLIGPEGGFSDFEISQAVKHGFIPLNLGPRILRTETAAVAAMAVLQCRVGDFC